MAWVFYILCCCLAASAEIHVVVQPESTSVLLGENATFSCVGEDVLTLVWSIDDIDVDFLGIVHTDEVHDGVHESSVIVTGSIENNNASVQCIILTSSLASIPLPPVFLTVLGIGQVPIIELLSAVHTSLTCIQWKEPVFVSTDVKDLMYNVSVGEAGLPLFTNTTSETQYCLELTPCQEYNITVTPFSPSLGYVGAINRTTATVEGGNYYYLREEPCVLSEVEVFNINNVTVFFACQVLPCPHQYLQIIIAAETNDTDSGMLPINSTVYLDGSETSIVTNVSGLLAERKYRSNFSIMDVNRSVVHTVNTSLPFSTYNVQNATFLHPPDSSVVSITCRFATGAFASACRAHFENTSLGLYFDGSVPYSDTSSLVSSRNISIPQKISESELSRVVFDAKVFDVYGNGNDIKKPALERKGGLKIELENAKPSADTSTHTTGASTLASPSFVSTEVPSYVTIVSVAVPVSVVLVILAVAVCVGLLFCYIYKRKTKSVNFLTQVCVSQITKSSHGVPRSDSNANNNGVVASETPPSTMSSDCSSLVEARTNAEGTQNHVHEEELCQQGSHGVFESGSETHHPNFVPSNEVSSSLHSATPPPYNYSSVKRPRPSVPPRPPEFGGIEVEHVHVEKKATVDCGELGARPGSAPPPPVRPPETKDSNGVHESDERVPDANHPNVVGSGEKMPHTLHSPTPSAIYSSKVCEKKSELPEKRNDHVVYAELGARPVNATPVLPPETRVHYMDVNLKRTPKGITSITSSPEVDGKEDEQSGIKKENMVYAELGVKPNTAPPILPPETSVQYMTVKPTCTTKDTKDTNSFTSGSASKFPSYVDEQSQEREVGASSFELWELQPEVENNEDGLTKGVFNRDASIVTFHGSACSVRDASTAAHNLSEMVIADFPKPEVFEGKSVNQNTDAENEAPCRNASTTVQKILEKIYANIPKPKVFEDELVSQNTNSENEASCLVFSSCRLPLFASISKLGRGICFEVDKNDDPAITPENEVEASGCKESGKLMIAVEADYCHQEEPSSTDPCQDDDRKVVNELMVGKEPSSEDNCNPLPSHCAQGNQKACCSAPSYPWFFFFYYCP